MLRMDAATIQVHLGLSPRARALESASRRCEDYLMDRPLTVEPIVAMLLEAGDASSAGRRAALETLRLFRASVRALDDVMDGSVADPHGRPAAWTLFGIDATIHNALGLWEHAVNGQSQHARAFVMHESARMLAAAKLELDFSAAAGHARLSVERLRAVERRIRDKEWSYWRLISRLVEPQWRSEPWRLVATQKLLTRLGDVWQRADDVRDFEEDVRARRLSSFIVDVMSADRRAHAQSFAARVEALEHACAPSISTLRATRLWSLEREEASLRGSIAAVLGLRHPW